MQEGEPLEHEVAAARDAQLLLRGSARDTSEIQGRYTGGEAAYVRAPMLEAIAGEAPEDLESLLLRVRARARARVRARVRVGVRVRVRARARVSCRGAHWRRCPSVAAPSCG